MSDILCRLASLRTGKPVSLTAVSVSGVMLNSIGVSTGAMDDELDHRVHQVDAVRSRKTVVVEDQPDLASPRRGIQQAESLGDVVIVQLGV
jgi:hypothetical protein